MDKSDTELQFQAVDLESRLFQFHASAQELTNPPFGSCTQKVRGEDLEPHTLQGCRTTGLRGRQQRVNEPFGMDVSLLSEPLKASRITFLPSACQHVYPVSWSTPPARPPARPPACTLLVLTCVRRSGDVSSEGRGPARVTAAVQTEAFWWHSRRRPWWWWWWRGVRGGGSFRPVRDPCVSHAQDVGDSSRADGANRWMEASLEVEEKPP